MAVVAAQLKRKSVRQNSSDKQVDTAPTVSPRRLPWVRLAGEFVIIVAGVLAALAADSWNDARLERRQESAYLERLHVDLEQDTASFRTILHWIDRKEKGLNRLSTLLADRAELFDPDTVLADLAAASNFGWNVGPLTRQATYEDLRSSGRLGIIAAPVLRGQIVEYYGAAEGEDRRLQARRTRYPDLSYQLIPFQRDGSRLDEFVPVRDVSALLERLRESELPQFVLAERNRAGFIRGSVTRMLELSTDLLTAIDDETAGRSADQTPSGKR